MSKRTTTKKTVVEKQETTPTITPAVEIPKKKPTAVKNATKATEPVKIESIKPEPVKSEPVKSEPVKSEPVKVEPAKPVKKGGKNVKTVTETKPVEPVVAKKEITITETKTEVKPVETKTKKSQPKTTKKTTEKAIKVEEKPVEKSAEKSVEATPEKKKAGARKDVKKSANSTEVPKKKETKKAAPKKKKEVAQVIEGGQVEGENAEELPGTRYFKVLVDGGEAHGRFCGTKPKQAANKALTSILKDRQKSGGAVNGAIKFSIVECTRKSKHKQYNYVGERIRLTTPMKVVINKTKPNPKEIEYKFNNRVMKDKEAVVVAA